VKIGVCNPLFSDQRFEDFLDMAVGLGIQAVELGTGAYPGDAHAKPKDLLRDTTSLKKFKKAIGDRNLEISAFCCHGNLLHPSRTVAQEHQEVHRNTVLLAEQLEVERVVTFAGCPGDSENAKYPNFVACAWPPDFQSVLDWQWKEKVIPFWKNEADFADKHGVRICFEMMPGFVVYNTETLFRLRQAVGKTLGANFDPSHLFWQGIDPVASIRKLGEAIYYVHIKDAAIDPLNCALNGVLDTKPFGDELGRSWIFRTVGYGHGYELWKNIISALRLVGYDYVLSIEHEDSLMSPREGLAKAVSFLKEIILTEKRGKSLL
jgi:sugar phosphate isomerase/epimerase